MGLYSLTNYGFLHLLDTFFFFFLKILFYKKTCTLFKIENFKFKKGKGKSPTQVEA